MALRQKKLCTLTAAEKIRIIEQLIHKVELFPKGMKIHHYVGKKRLTTAPEPNSGASYTVLSDTLVGTRKESKKICEKNVSSSLTNGGPDRDRTDYLLTASQTLSQMSYEPLFYNLLNHNRICNAVCK